MIGFRRISVWIEAVKPVYGSPRHWCSAECRTPACRPAQDESILVLQDANKGALPAYH
jgi:hypothetical protein